MSKFDVENWAEGIMRTAGLSLMGLRVARKLKEPFIAEDFKLRDLSAPPIEWLHDHGYVKVFSEGDVAYLLFTQSGIDAIGALIYGNTDNIFVRDKLKREVVKDMERENKALASENALWGTL